MYNTPFHDKDLGRHSILVTGGAGFIGSHLVEYLLKYGVSKVLVLDDLSTGSLNNIKDFQSASNFEFIEGDITDMETCLMATQGVDLVLHQAALGSVPRSIKDPLTTYKVNAMGSLNVFEACRENKVNRVVYASSSSVYGDDKNLPKLEEKMGKLLSPYAVTKRSNELNAMVFSNTYDMQIIGLRYFNVFGPRQDPSGPYAAVIPRFMQAVIDKTDFTVFGDGTQSRDFTFVENAVQANIRALFADKGTQHPVYNVAVSEKYSILDLIDQIKAITGSEQGISNLPPRQGDIKDSQADISKATNSLDYASLIGLEEGLKITWEDFKQLH